MCHGEPRNEAQRGRAFSLSVFSWPDGIRPDGGGRERSSASVAGTMGSAFIELHSAGSFLGTSFWMLARLAQGNCEGTAQLNRHGFRGDRGGGDDRARRGVRL